MNTPTYNEIEACILDHIDISTAKWDGQDRASVKAYLHGALLNLVQKTMEACLTGEAWHRERGFILKQTSEREEGWNDCRIQILTNFFTFMSNEKEI